MAISVFSLPLKDAGVTPQGCLQSHIYKGRSCTLLLLWQQMWCGSILAAGRIKEPTQLWGWWPRHEEEGQWALGGEGMCHRQCRDTDPQPPKMCCFSPCLSNGEYDTCLWTLPPLLATIAPWAEVSVCAARQISPWTGKTNPFTSPCQVTSCFLKEEEKKRKKILVLLLNKIPGIQQPLVCSGGGRKGLGWAQYILAQFKTQRMPLQKLCMTSLREWSQCFYILLHVFQGGCVYCGC